MFFRLLFYACTMHTFMYAHPHVFLDTYVEVLPDKIRVNWVFDEMSSAMLMEDYDKNRDKKLDANEVAFMEKDHFKALEPYSYFMHIFDGKNESDIHETNEFSALFEKRKLIYAFSIAKPKIKKYELRFYDPEMFVALILKKKFLTCKEVKCSVEGYDADFYYAYKVMIHE
ncbi:ABC-type uncharacterized transport system, periplasmic component [Sulfurospirillum barnesii SES-3]|uniref:ABC-type uncharacterized transport system, periplasmic component n=1 Tax=Sulfurospirillum barnesii (strain ATCC 700032 / DSM 10660 / SES-3) TaxID=760154 RepID=I3XZP7_SULBS|nr:DUF1007 family protein [Sulfurospirillum barnesii]AFL69421.1 ABC-type uncharacterized transport system, periplasmic component [Sulfurospirillum barnesii SES-3]